MRPVGTGVGRVTPVSETKVRSTACCAWRRCPSSWRCWIGAWGARWRRPGRQVFGFSFDCERYLADIFFGCDCASPMRPGHMIKFNCDITCPIVLFPPFSRAMDDALSVLVRDMCSRWAGPLGTRRACSGRVASHARGFFSPRRQPAPSR